MFTNLLQSSGDGLPAPETTLDPAGLFDIFGEFDPSFVSDTIPDLSFLDAAAATNAAAPRKRALNVDDDDDVDASDDTCSSKDADSPTPKKTRQKKPRRPTHVMVKIQHLTLQATLLRQQAGVADPEIVAAKNALNLALRDAVLQHDLKVASTQSAFSGYMNARAMSPLETYIHLGTNWDQRHRVLQEMRDRKIAVGRAFLLERTRHMNPFKPSCELSSYETEQGDVCIVKVDVTPFEGVKSVLDVFRALQFYFSNMEISKTELSGKVTIRENEAKVDDYVMQHRIVTSEGPDVSQESNVVVFYDVSGLSAERADDQCVIMASDFVDRDDLYPYRPSERVRKDASSVMKLSAHRRCRPRPTDAAESATDSQAYVGAEQEEKGEEEEEFVVVLTRAFFVRLHRSEVDIPKHVLQTIIDGMTDSIDAMVKSTQSGLRQLSLQNSDIEQI